MEKDKLNVSSSVCDQLTMINFHCNCNCNCNVSSSSQFTMINCNRIDYQDKLRPIMFLLLKRQAQLFERNSSRILRKAFTLSPQSGFKTVEKPFCVCNANGVIDALEEIALAFFSGLPVPRHSLGEEKFLTWVKLMQY